MELHRYSGYIEQAAGCLDLAIQVDATKRRGRPRKIDAVWDQQSGPAPNVQTSKCDLRFAERIVWST